MFLTNILVFVTLFINGYVLGVSIFQLYILRTFIKAMRNSPEVVSGEHYQAVREGAMDKLLLIISSTLCLLTVVTLFTLS